MGLIAYINAHNLYVTRTYILLIYYSYITHVGLQDEATLRLSELEDELDALLNDAQRGGTPYTLHPAPYTLHPKP